MCPYFSRFFWNDAVSRAPTGGDITERFLAWKKAAPQNGPMNKENRFPYHGVDLTAREADMEK